jgi:hypothetical protein
MTQGAADKPHDKPPAKQPDKGADGATDDQSQDTAAVVPTDDAVQKVRAWTGLLVVAVGDIAIVIAAIVGIAHVSNDSANTSSIVAILSSGFTAVGTMTTAYFGIRAASNTAQSSMKKPTG